MLAFFLELFIVGTILLHLLFNAKSISAFNNNFPLVCKTTYFQTCLIFFISFLCFTILLNFNTFNTLNLFSFYFSILNIKILIIFFALLIINIIYIAFSIQKLNFFEFFSLFLYSVLSLLLLTSVENLISLYLIIEMQALCFYILASFLRNSAFSTEAGLKYFITSSVISGIFLFGIFAVYATLGTINFYEIYNLLNFSLNLSNIELNYLCLLGVLLVVLTFLFKIACAPFHWWAPDVYEGAPLSSTIVFSIIPKMAILYVLTKWISVVALFNQNFTDIFIFCGCLSCVLGTIFALYQNRVKRLIIYSSIAQIGFIVTILSINSISSLTSITFFLVIYLITAALIWGYIVIFFCSQSKFSIFFAKKLGALNISSFVGLFNRNKTLAMALVIIFFSIAGIPPFAGFFAKLVILIILLTKNYYFIASVLIVISSLSVFYYIRIIKTFFFEPKIVVNAKNFFNHVIFSPGTINDIFYILTLLLVFLLLPILLDSVPLNNTGMDPAVEQGIRLGDSVLTKTPAEMKEELRRATEKAQEIERQDFLSSPYYGTCIFVILAGWIVACQWML